MAIKPQLQFILNPDYDGEMIYGMLKNQSQSGLKYQAENMELDLDLAQKISQAKTFKEVEEEIKKLVVDRYQRIVDKMKKAKDLYQKSWDEINDSFFNRLPEITNFPIQYNIFYCVVSAFHIGISNWRGNKIVRRFNYDPDHQRRITAHELIISHFFSMMKEKYTSKLSEKQIWQLAEIFAFIITGLDEVMISFWPWDKSGVYTDHNYPEIVDLQNRLTKIYQKEGFESFIEQGIKSFSK